jgi:hypothetical protein
MSPEIEYDVRNVPFPLERDPAIDGIRRGSRVKKRRPLAREHEPYRLFSEEELGAFPPVSWFIRGYLAIGEMTVFYGKGDTYKSFVALDWSCHLAQHGVPVVYVVAEGASGIKARIAAWRTHHGVEALPSLRLMPANVLLHQERDVQTFVAALAAQLDNNLPGLVVIDTLARNFVGGNESSPQDMGEFVEGVETLRREFKSAVLVIHHSTKDGKAERGTESLRNASFAMFEFQRTNQSRQVKVTCDRMKDAAPPPPVTLRPVKIDLPELGEGVSSLVAAWPYGGADTDSLSRRADAGGEREKGAKHSRLDRSLLGAIAGASGGANLTELAKRLRISPRSASRHLNALVKQGFLAAEGTTRDRLFTITSKGRRSIE